MERKNLRTIADQGLYVPRHFDVLETPAGVGIVVSVKRFKDVEQNEEVILTGMLLDSGEVAHVYNLFIDEIDLNYRLVGRCSTAEFISAQINYYSCITREGVEVIPLHTTQSSS